MFQILPVPPGAPQPTFLSGDHPFLLEYSYRQSNDGRIDSERRTRELTKLQLLLNALLVSDITAISTTIVGSGHHWTLLPTDQVQVQYLQEGYWYKDVWPHGSFSPTNELSKIPKVQPADYYAKGRISAGVPLDLPEDLAFTFDQFFALSPVSQDRFLRACYWLAQTNETSSFSSMLLSAVQAIEALIQTPKGSRRCQHCGLRLGPSTTQVFNAFLDSFLPEDFKNSEDLTSLYAVRSQLTHGHSAPLMIDFDPWFFSLNPREQQQRETVWTALRTARLCLRNWVNCEPC
jgi:hypothetical protein